jgi:hypothetical protein
MDIQYWRKFYKYNKFTEVVLGRAVPTIHNWLFRSQLSLCRRMFSFVHSMYDALMRLGAMSSGLSVRLVANNQDESFSEIFMEVLVKAPLGPAKADI